MPSSNGVEELSQPRDAGSDDMSLHPPVNMGKKMSAPGNLQPYVQVHVCPLCMGVFGCVCTYMEVFLYGVSQLRPALLLAQGAVS